jgi:uncharacterized membrane protein YkvI
MKRFLDASYFSIFWGTVHSTIILFMSSSIMMSLSYVAKVTIFNEKQRRISLKFTNGFLLLLLNHFLIE